MIDSIIFLAGNHSLHEGVALSETGGVAARGRCESSAIVVRESDW
jgi:hypothetical protein